MISMISKLLQLFKNVLPARNMDDLERRLAKAQEREDLPALSKIYYEMGLHCMKNDDPDRAMMYLSRSDSIYSSRDDVFKKVKESMREDCSRRIGELEELPLLTNQIQEQIGLQAEESLDDLQTRLWGLLTMARLVQTGKRLSVLAGCEVLGQLGQAVDLIFHSFQEPVSQEEYQFLMDICNELYDLGDDACFSDMTKQVEIPGSAPLQAFDLNGLIVLTELNLYIDSHLRLLSEGPDDSEAETGLIACALLPDYYLRTCKGDLSGHIQIRQEIERIQDDFAFVCSRFSWKDAAERIAEYQEMDVLTVQQ